MIEGIVIVGEWDHIPLKYKLVQVQGNTKVTINNIDRSIISNNWIDINYLGQQIC